MKFKRIVSFVSVLLLLCTLMPTVGFAKTTTKTQLGWEKYPVVHKGINWQLTNATTESVVTDDHDTASANDDTTTTSVIARETVSYINDAGNLYSSTEGKTMIKSSCPYGMYLYSSDNPGNMFKKANFTSDHDFEVKFRHSDYMYVMFYTGKYRHYIQINGDSEIDYMGADGISRTVEADVPFNKWHILRLSVRSGNIGTIYLDGKEIVTYEMVVFQTSNPYVMFATYHVIDSAASGIYNSAEIEYATLQKAQGSTSTSSNDILLSGVTQGQKFNVGDTVLLKANTSTGGDSVSDTGVNNGAVSVYSDYYINGQKAGTDDVSTSNLWKYVNRTGQFVPYTKYVNKGFKYTFTSAGTFEIYAQNSKSKRSATVTVSVAEDKSALLNAAEKINYGEALQTTVMTNGIDNAVRYDFYAGGELKKSQTSNTASLTGFPVGKTAVFAKVICSDGSEYTTPTKLVEVDAGVVASGAGNILFGREYQLDYTYTETSGADSTLTVSDGYFLLDFKHNGNTIIYTDSNNQSQTYTGVGNGIGSGKYRIVATSGNAEVYYNDHFLFSCLLPTSSNSQNIAYAGGISAVSLKNSGVKAERFYGVWNTEEAIECYNLDFDRFYSLEFNKDNTENETIVIYDGEYQAKLIFDENGITAYSQFEQFSNPENFNLTDTIQTGYYRLTVAHGLAQLFVNNRLIKSFACPVNPHAKCVMRSAVTTSAPRMISVKDTDDVYYHNENFENDTEYDYTNYWFSEYEGTAAEEGETDLFTQQIETEGANHYLTIRDNGLQPEQYEGYQENNLISQPVGDWSLNASPDNPKFKWRAKADGTGEIHFMARHYQKGFFNSISYNFDDAKWYVNRYSIIGNNVSFEIDKGEKNANGTPALTNYTKIRRIDRAVLEETSNNPLDTGWHNYEMVLEDNYIGLLCDGTMVIEHSNLEKGHGKVGFGVSYGAKLSIDDVEYAGNSVVASGLRYFSFGDMANNSTTVVTGYAADGITPKKTESFGDRIGQGSKDFYKTPTLGVVAASANYYSYNSSDGGKTWSKVLGTTGHQNRLYPNAATLNLKSGLFMRIGAVNWGKPIYDENGNIIEKDSSYVGKRLYSTVLPNADYDTVPQLNGSWGNENMVVDPYDFPSNIYNQSTIASQLVQVQDGDYEGRIFMSKTIGGERYGGDVVFYTDMDRDFIRNGANLSQYYDATRNRCIKILDDDWQKSQTDLVYSYLGTDAQESKVVDLPNSVLRLYYRCESGFLQYSESFDGGVTWSKAQPSEFISPRCSYGIVRDPNNLNHYYALWEYDANTADKSNDGGRPRTRLALAVSFDGMNTWQYLGDMEELTDNWRKSNDGVSTLSTPQNHGLRVIDGAVYMSYSSNNIALDKIFTMDTNKLKPLARFSEVHDKLVTYVNGAQEISKRAAVIPKTAGKGKIYGTDIKIAATNGNYSADIIKKIMGEDIGSLTPDANGNFDIVKAATAFGKKIIETENAYIISDTEISRTDMYYLEGICMEKTAEDDAKEEFLNRLNLAAQYGDVESMQKLIDDNSEILGNTIDTSNTRILEKMLDYRYYKTEDVNKMYNIIEGALTTEPNKGRSALLLSTALDGFDNWVNPSGGNAANVSVKNGALKILGNNAYTNKYEFGTSELELPDTDKYILNFDVQIDENSDARIKWGNAAHLMQIVLNSSKFTDFSVKNDEIPLTIQPKVWYNFCVKVTKSESGRNVIVKIAKIANDVTVGEYTDYIFDGVTGTSGKEGFWIESNGVTARNIRIYCDNAIEVTDFKAADGKASATVNFLNFDNETVNIQPVMNIFNGNVFDKAAFLPIVTETIAPMEIKKFNFTDIPYTVVQGVEPTAGFLMWNNASNMRPVVETVKNVKMRSTFSDDFSGKTLNTLNYNISGGNVENAFLGVESGVLKMRKSVENTFDLHALLEPQTDNMLVSYDIKINELSGMLQVQWYGDIYKHSESESSVERIVYYIQPDKNGNILLKTGGHGGGDCNLNTDVWYTVLMTVNGSGANKSIEFYLKERDSNQDFTKLFSNNTITTKSCTNFNMANKFRFYEGHGSQLDVSIDNLKIINGTLSK